MLIYTILILYYIFLNTVVKLSPTSRSGETQLLLLLKLMTQ